MNTVYDFNPVFPHTNFRVALVGSHSVGKTAQLVKLAKVLRVPTITEGVRHVVQAMGLTSVRQVTDPVLLQWKTLQYQLHAEKERPLFLSDRSTLDNAAYFQYYCLERTDFFKKLHARGVQKSEADAYFTLARGNASTYTHLIYFPIAWEEIEDDNCRSTDPRDRNDVDQIVRDYLKALEGMENAPKVYKVSKDDKCDGPNARLTEILEFLDLWQLMREHDIQRGAA